MTVAELDALLELLFGSKVRRGGALVLLKGAGYDDREELASDIDHERKK